MPKSMQETHTSGSVVASSDRRGADAPSRGPRRDPVRPRVAVLFHRFGPYHVKRLEAAAEHVDIEGVEFSRSDRTYMWTPIEGRLPFRRHVFFEDIDAESGFKILQRVGAVLSALEADAVAIPGWSHPAALAALLWCSRSRTPAILMCDNTAFNKTRYRWKEWIKRHVLSLFSSALVAGQPHRDYLTRLGMTPNRIFDGYDVVDNGFFSLGADAARKCAAEERVRLALPKPFFLSCCRFIPEKNLIRLLEAYKMYRDLSEAATWDLVLVGDGPLQTQLAQWVSQHDLRDYVHMPGFIQYENLPAYYGLAEVFILPSISETWGLAVNEAMAAGLPVLVSEACGCSSDLMASGRVGYTFNPHSADELVRLLASVASDHLSIEDMGKAAQAAIAKWSPARFGNNLVRAVQAARGVNQRHQFVNELLISALLIMYPERRHKPS